MGAGSERMIRERKRQAIAALGDDAPIQPPRHCRHRHRHRSLGMRDLDIDDVAGADRTRRLRRSCEPRRWSAGCSRRRGVSRRHRPRTCRRQCIRADRRIANEGRRVDDGRRDRLWPRRQPKAGQIEKGLVARLRQDRLTSAPGDVELVVDGMSRVDPQKVATADRSIRRGLPAAMSCVRCAMRSVRRSRLTWSK